MQNLPKIVIVILFISANLYSQKSLDKLTFLIGEWQGVESGMAGDGIGYRTYSKVMFGNYIFVENTSTFPVSQKNPRGEVHQDIGVFSYNANITNIVFREFHTEGFVNIYTLDTLQSSEKSFVFVTREIENNPGNWKARLTLTKISDTEFDEFFEIATDGETYKDFLKNNWKKIE